MAQQWLQELDDFLEKDKIEIAQVIENGGKLLVKAAESLAPGFKRRGLTTSQIRNVFGTVKKMEINGFNAHEFILLKPKLAYAAARANTMVRTHLLKFSRVLSKL
mgnify:CR=1 FL=1